MLDIYLKSPAKVKSLPACQSYVLLDRIFSFFSLIFIVYQLSLLPFFFFFGGGGGNIEFILKKKDFFSLSK